jgi:membrane-associated phospholipid phosphatase
MRLPETFSASQAAPATATGSARRDLLARVPHLSSLLLAGGMLVLTFGVAAATRLPVRDPDAVVAYRSRIFMIALALAIFPMVDVLVRGGVRAGWRRGRVWEEMKTVRRERWDRRRMLIAVSAVLSFYITYFAYRNLKSFLPVLREATFDSALLHLDHALLWGNDPAVLLHDVLGTGVAGQLLSWVYLLYLTFVPISVVAAVAWSRRVAAGVWYVTAVNVNWVLGILSYYLVPSLGPVFVDPPLADQMPVTQVWNLQQLLLVDRLRFVADPAGSGAIQSIAGFASLHVSVLFSAALMAHLLGAWRSLRVGLWILLGLTALSTVYFGWHYLIDDVAGLAIGGVSVWLAGVATGWRGLPGRRSRTGGRTRPPADAPVTAGAEI